MRHFCKRASCPYLSRFLIFSFISLQIGKMVFESYHQNRLAKSEKSGYFKTLK